jgi:hypothetical protein
MGFLPISLVFKIEHSFLQWTRRSLLWQMELNNHNLSQRFWLVTGIFRRRTSVECGIDRKSEFLIRPITARNDTCESTVFCVIGQLQLVPSGGDTGPRRTSTELKFSVIYIRGRAARIKYMELVS